MRRIWLLAIAVVALPFTVSAQDLQPTPNLDLWQSGEVRAVVITADGGRVIGGDFQAVGGQARSHLARLLPDGTLDPAWDVPANGAVNALAIDTQGRIYVGGDFTDIGGQPRNKIARLSASGTVDANWDPSPSAPAGTQPQIRAMLLIGTELYVAGRYNSIAGQARSNVARFSSSDGALDASWAPPVVAAGAVSALAADASHLYLNAGASLAQVVGRISRSGAGTIDAGWTPVVAGSVSSVAVDALGFAYLAGDFTAIGGTARSGLAKLSTNAGAAVDAQWAPLVVGSVSTLALQGTALYVGGGLRSVAGQSVAGLARVATTGVGAVDGSFLPEVYGGSVAALAITASALYAGGSFTEVNGNARSAWAELSPSNGQLLGSSAAVERSPGVVQAILRQANGGVIVGGRFTRAGSVARQNLLRLTPDGQLDLNWQMDVNGRPLPYRLPPEAGFGFQFLVAVSALAEDVAGRVYVGGAFERATGGTRQNVLRLTSAGLLDSGWNPGADGLVSAIGMDAIGDLYLGGNFETVGAVSRSGIAKLSAGASVDPNWTANLSLGALPTAIETGVSGYIYVGGSGFASINGQPVTSALHKIQASSGALDSNWSVAITGPERSVNDIALGSDGWLYVAGPYAGIGGQSISALARVNPSGTGVVDTSWMPVAGFGTRVQSIAIGADRTVYASTNSGVAAYSSTSGAMEPNWPLLTDARVQSLALAGDTLYLGGDFKSVSSQNRKALARVGTSRLYGNGFE